MAFKKCWCDIVISVIKLKKIEFITYYYNADDDCLHADCVSIPFNYKKEDITNKIIYESLEMLDEKVREYYLSKGIELYDYD